MAEPLDTLLVELEEFGKANDSTTTERPRRMLNITRDTGEIPGGAGPRDAGLPGARDRHLERLLDPVARRRGARDRRVGDYRRAV